MTQRSALFFFPFLLVFYEIATYLSNDMYLPSLPQMMSDLGLTVQEAQLTLTVWFLGSASMPLVIGAVSDRYGRRPILLLGGVIYILASIVCAVTANVATLLAARFVEGSMIPSMMVPGYACVHESYEQKEAVRILALMGSISVLAPAFGPLLGSIVLYFLNWRGIFWVIVAWAVIAITLLYLWMPESLPKEKREPLHLGSLMKSYGRIITNRQFILRMCVLGFIFGGFIAWIAAGPLLVIESFHYSAMAFGLIQALVFSAYIYGNRKVKYFMGWLAIHKLIKLGLVVTLVGGLLVLASAAIFPNSLYAFLVPMMLYSFGSALCFAPLNRSVIEASDEPMGVRMAIFSILLSTFAVLGSGMASIFYNGTIMSLASLVGLGIIFSCIINVWLTRG